MKAFLVQFNRFTAEVIVTAFDDNEAAIRSLHEREAGRAAEEEVVLLFASSREALEKTHGRYFRPLAQLAAQVGSAAAG